MDIAFVLSAYLVTSFEYKYGEVSAVWDLGAYWLPRGGVVGV